MIRESFMTVAEQFGLTGENAPRFTAFAATEERLLRQMDCEHHAAPFVERPYLLPCEQAEIFHIIILLFRYRTMIDPVSAARSMHIF